MNNLKFRAFDPATKRMLKPSFDLVIEFHTNPFGEAYTVVFADNKRIENAIVMQYTGLKDQYDIEIFDGDVIDYCDEYMDGSMGDVEEAELVEFEGCGFKPMSGEYWSGKNVVVIGNIHQNPDLYEV